MAGRRKKWLVAAVVLAFVAALGWALFGRAGKMEVQLAFVGYTNYTTTFTSPAPASVVFTGHVFRAIVMATNSGNVTVELSLSLRTLAVLSDGRFAAPIGMDPPRILKPGETLLVEVVPQSALGVPWYAELMAQRRGVLDRLYVKAVAKGGGAVRRIVTSYMSPPPTVRLTLGPITDLPPREWTHVWAALGGHTNSPPAR